MKKKQQKTTTKKTTTTTTKKTGLKGLVKCVSINFNTIDTSNVLDIHKSLMKRKQYKKGLG